MRCSLSASRSSSILTPQGRLWLVSECLKLRCRGQRGETSQNQFYSSCDGVVCSATSFEIRIQSNFLWSVAAFTIKGQEKQREYIYVYHIMVLRPQPKYHLIVRHTNGPGLVKIMKTDAATTWTKYFCDTRHPSGDFALSQKRYSLTDREPILPFRCLDFSVTSV